MSDVFATPESGRGGPVLEIQRAPMSWQEFRRLSDPSGAEWLDGVAVLMPPVGFDHGDAVGELMVLLRPLLRPLPVVTEVGVWLPRNRLRAPDLMVLRERPRTEFVTEPPLLCVEVLSPATRSEDLIHKAAEYAEAGVGQYWIVDPELRAIDVLGLDAHRAWETIAHLGEARPSADVELAGVVVPLDLRIVLGAGQG